MGRWWQYRNCWWCIIFSPRCNNLIFSSWISFIASCPNFPVSLGSYLFLLLAGLESSSLGDFQGHSNNELGPRAWNFLKDGRRLWWVAGTDWSTMLNTGDGAVPVHAKKLSAHMEAISSHPLACLKVAKPEDQSCHGQEQNYPMPWSSWEYWWEFHTPKDSLFFHPVSQKWV